MQKSKRTRLEAKGWKIGGVAEFLSLSREESAYIELKLKLAGGLRERRRLRHLTQIEVSKRLGSSQSRVAKMEAGDGSVTLDLIVRSLLALGATRHDLVRIISS